MRKYFAVASVVFLAVLAISPFKDYFREWRLYQYRYNAIAKDLPQKVAAAPIGIRQIWNQDFDRVDRCITCHLGVKEEALRNAPQPYRTHPRIHHDVEEFGCTICHEGQGAATEFKESVGRVKYWDKPVLPRAYMEASCAKCHKEENVPEAPVVNAGRKLIAGANCSGCHNIPGFERQWVPPLTGIGSKVNRQWLAAWLKNPKGYFAGTRMPNFLLQEDELNNLADFLLAPNPGADTIRLDSLPPPLRSPTEDQKSKMVELGSTRFKEARCISCHAVNGKGGTVATDLGKVASKVNEVWLYNYIRNPKRVLPGVQMPRYRFSEGDLEAVVAYIESEFVDYDLESPAPHTPDPAFYEKGLAVVKKYNCTGCHILGGMNKAEEMAPDLSFIGNKNLYEIEFGKSGIEQSLPSYLTAKLLTPRVFAPTLKMPDFGFSREEARSIAVALLGNTNENIPQKYVVHAKPKSTFNPQGKFGALVNDLACMSCHVMENRGRMVATDLSLEASQAQESWIKGYFKIPYSLRPILTERMPNFFMPDSDIAAITDYMGKVFIADSLNRTVAHDDVTIAKGKSLYFERYGCQSCHQIGSNGGYVGPPLDKASQRLKAGWVFHWLKNPQAYRPDSIEPNNNLTDGDAEALTAFVMSLN